MRQLVDAGLVTKETLGTQTLYSANQASPVFQEMRSLVAKTVGVHDALLEGRPGVQPRQKRTQRIKESCTRRSRDQTFIDRQPQTAPQHSRPRTTDPRSPTTNHRPPFTDHRPCKPNPTKIPAYADSPFPFPSLSS
jgi:hypothetical protein